jgi:hypothetical protein
VTEIKTDNNPGETLSNQELTARLDHLDSGQHEILQKLAGIQEFIDQHRPALARAMGMLDPGARLRAAMGKKPRHGG